MDSHSAAPVDVWRVKLYVLNDEGEWVDKGTGSVSLNKTNNGQALVLQVVTESQTQETILYSAVNPDFSYERQGENIITWKDEIPVLCGPDISKVELEKWSENGNVDIALSFQEIEGQKDMWKRICAAQGHYSSDFVGGENGGANRQPQSMYSSVGGGSNLTGAGTAPVVPLPTCEMKNLPDIRQLLDDLMAFEKIATAKQIMEEDYVPKLLQLFSDAEDLEDVESLHHLYIIFRGLLHLNHPGLIHSLVEVEIFPMVAGVFEYNPVFVKDCKNKAHYREEIEMASYKEVVSLEEYLPQSCERMKNTIKKAFYVDYLRDCVMKQTLDDCTVEELVKLSFGLKSEIVSELCDSPSFMLELFRKIKYGVHPSERDQIIFDGEPDQDPDRADTPHLERENALLLLKELCAMARLLSKTDICVKVHQILYERLGLFETMRGVLADTHTPPSPNELLAISEVMSENVNHVPTQFRAHVIDSEFHPEKPVEFPSIANGVVGKIPTASSTTAGSKGRTLLYLLLHLFEETDDTGVLFHVSELVKNLINPEFHMETSDKDTYLECFYNYYYPWLLNPLQEKEWERAAAQETKKVTITNGSETAVAAVMRRPSAIARNHVCELLTFCVRCHNFRIKYYLLRCNMVDRILALLEYGEKHLHLSAIRFIRSCVGHKDDFYNRFICEKGHLARIFRVFFDNGDKNNMVNSAVIELMEFVKSENLKLLIQHIAEKFGDQLKDHQYVQTGNNLLQKYEQHQEKLHRKVDLSLELGGNPSQVGQKRKPAIDDDESYFESDDAMHEDTTENLDSPDRSPPRGLASLKKEEEEDNLMLFNRGANTAGKQKKPLKMQKIAFVLSSNASPSVPPVDATAAGTGTVTIAATAAASFSTMGTGDDVVMSSNPSPQQDQGMEGNSNGK